MELISILVWAGIIVFGYIAPAVASFKSSGLVYEPEGSYTYFGQVYTFNDRIAVAAMPAINVAWLIYTLTRYFSDKEFHDASRKYFAADTDPRLVKIEKMTQERHDKKVKALEQELDMARKELY